MDTENELLLVQEAGAALAKAMKWVKTEENRRQEEDVPARAQAELYEALLDANRALLGCNSDVVGKQWQQPTDLPFSFSQCLHLETRGGVFARHRCGFRRVELAIHHP